MNISFFSSDENAAITLAELRRRLPTHNILAWPDIGDASQLDYAVCWRAPELFFSGATNLKAVFSLGAGVDHLLDHPGLPAGVPIIRLADAGMADKIAEYVHYGVTRWHRRFDSYEKQQAMKTWQPLADRHAIDYQVGIMGMGVIGTKIASTLAAAGYTVKGWKRAPQAESPIPIFAGETALQSFLSNLDTLVCVLPLTPKTTGIINAELLYQLPKGATLINVGRGAQVVESDLLQALTDKQLCGAMLDVCQTEPPDADHPFWQHPDILLTPHIAGPTQIEQSVTQIAHGIEQLQSGEHHLTQALVDNTQGY